MLWYFCLVKWYKQLVCLYLIVVACGSIFWYHYFPFIYSISFQISTFVEFVNRFHIWSLGCFASLGSPIRWCLSPLCLELLWCVESVLSFCCFRGARVFNIGVMSCLLVYVISSFLLILANITNLKQNVYLFINLWDQIIIKFFNHYSNDIQSCHD